MTKPLTRTRKALVLGALILLPLLILAVMRSGRHNFRYLPYYGPKEVNAPGDTSYFEVPPFAFTDAYGHAVTDANTAGRIVVADFFFTRCTSICPTMTRQMQQLQFKLDDPAFKDVLFLSHTVDPVNDSLPVLRKYARKWEADSSRWKFVTGNAADIYRLGNTGYLLSALEDSTAAEQFVHDERFVLVDKRRHIRGFYDGTNNEDVDRLVTDLKMLMKEEKERALKVGRFKE